jgi:flagellar M-ring protein FliF
MARTIQAMKGVKAARVHVVLPDSGSFRRSRQNPSASVIIRTEVAGDFNLAPAIRHLVAAGVPGLTVDQVTVLNTDGTILASGGDNFGASPGKMISLEKTISRELHDNIAKTLMPYLGINNFEISVATRLNTDKRQTNETSYNPETRVERSVRVVKETGNSQNTNSRSAVSVEQNVPADQSTTAAAGDQSKKTSERREETTNYEVSSKTTSTVSDGYKVENLAIAVVVNRKRLLASLGDGASDEVVDKQLKEVERLISSAAGVDLKRGDRVTVSAVEFIETGLSMQPVPPVGILEQLLHHTGSIVSAIAMVAVTMALIWFGLRPAMKAILEAKPLPAAPIQELRAEAVPGRQPAVAQNVATEAQPNLISDLTVRRDRAPQKRLEQLVDYDEEQAAAVLKDWMRGTQSA